jgi:predicted nucleic acid-binding protein
VTRIRVIVDTDILSMFAKAGAVHVLREFLGQDCIAMMPAIYDEIATPLQYGYTFPTQVLAQIPVAPLTTQVWQEYERLWTLRSSLGKGELEAIAFCKVKGALFVTNDAVAQKFARDHDVQVITLQALLQGVWLSGTQSKTEVRTLLERIKEADALEVPPEVEAEIFGSGDDEEPGNHP